MAKKKSVAKNYIYNLIYQLLTIITPLITTPYVARVLGVKNNGIYGYTLSILTYFVLIASLGTAMYGQREIAYVQDDKEKQSRVFWEINYIKLISFLITGLIYGLLFCISGKYAIYYRILLFELFANMIDISWYFQGIEEFKKTVVRNTIVKIIGLVLIFLLVKTRFDLWKYFLIYVLADFLGNLSLWAYVPKYLSKNVKEKNLKKHLKPIILLFLPQIAIQVYAVLDKTMIGQILNDMNSVAYYDQSQKIVKALLLIVCAMSAVISSRVANSYAKKNYNEIKKNLKGSISMVWLLAVPMIFGIIATSNVLVPIYFGPGYEKVISLMNWFTIIIIVIGLNNITGIQYLIQVEKQKEFTTSVTVGALVNVILNFILISKIGVEGAIFSSIVSEICVLAVQLFYTRDVIKIKDIITPSCKYLASGIIMYILLYFIKGYLNISIVSLMIEIIIGAIIYLLVLLLIKDKFLYSILNQILNSIKIKKGTK